jgi:hypothetical protein
VQTGDMQEIGNCEQDLRTLIHKMLEFIYEAFNLEVYKDRDFIPLFNNLTLAYFHLALCRIHLGKFDLAMQDAWRAAEICPEKKFRIYSSM